MRRNGALIIKVVTRSRRARSRVRRSTRERVVDCTSCATTLDRAPLTSTTPPMVAPASQMLPSRDVEASGDS